MNYKLGLIKAIARSLYHTQYFSKKLLLLKWFYAFKAAICILLDRDEVDFDLNDTGGYYLIAYTQSGTQSTPYEPPLHWAYFVAVGLGVRRNWWAAELSDSS